MATLTEGPIVGGTLLLLALSAVCANCARPEMMIGEVEWQRDDRFSGSDRRQIIEAARQAGFTQVRKVSKRFHRPSSDRYHALVESEQTVTGRRVAWMALIVCGEVDRHHCDDERGGRPWVQAGNWVTSDSSFRVERWRVIDAEWHIDVALDDGVTGSVVDTIVLAMRRQSLVNRTGLPDLLVRGYVDTALRHRFIGIDRRATDDGRYEVTTSDDGTGYVLEFGVTGDRVEVHRILHWDA